MALQRLQKETGLGSSVKIFRNSMSEIKVLCHSCHQPIHIEHLAGITKTDGKEAWFCDNICCLVEFEKIINSEKMDVIFQNERQKKEKPIKTTG